MRGDSLDDRSGVHIGARFEWLGGCFVHRGYQGIELSSEHVVIIVAPGVTRDPAARNIVCLGNWDFCRVTVPCAVIQRRDDDAPRAFDDTPRIAAARIAQVIHLAGMSAL